MENMPGMSSSMSMAPEMAMPSSAASTVSSSPSSVSTVGMNMSNETVQMDLLMDILYDTELQVTSNSYATRFWYGIIVVIGIAVAFNLFLRMISRSR
jgi:ferric-chelate reductase